MNPEFISKVKQGTALILIGAAFSIVPFYFQTNAMTEQIQQTNSAQTVEITDAQNRLHQLELQGAIDDTEIKQIKESLQRIEKKIDRLIEQRGQ